MSENNKPFFTAIKRDLLALELLESAIIIMESIKKYAKENGVDLTDCKNLNTLLADAKRIMQDLDYIDSLPNENTRRRNQTGTTQNPKSGSGDLVYFYLVKSRMTTIRQIVF